MLHKKTSSLSVTLLFLILVSSTAQAVAETAFQATEKIAGKYMGEWFMYGINKDGSVVEKAKWTDVLTAENPTETKNFSFVDVTDVMTFPDQTQRTSKFKEGYFSTSDQSAGDRFYEIMGTQVIFKKLTERDWSFQSTPSSWELQTMGFDPKTVIFASHVSTKTTTYVGQIDTDHVTRTTTVQWKTSDGIIKSMQFISMKGTHTRVD